MILQTYTHKHMPARVVVSGVPTTGLVNVNLTCIVYRATRWGLASGAVRCVDRSTLATYALDGITIAVRRSYSWQCGFVVSATFQASPPSLKFSEALDCCTTASCSTCSCGCGDSAVEERKRHCNERAAIGARIQISWLASDACYRVMTVQKQSALQNCHGKQAVDSGAVKYGDVAANLQPGNACPSPARLACGRGRGRGRVGWPVHRRTTRPEPDGDGGLVNGRTEKPTDGWTQGRIQVAIGGAINQACTCTRECRRADRSDDVDGEARPNCRRLRAARRQLCYPIGSHEDGWQ
ncbi:hypothetical protein LZ30DRAFT_384833 [Colletotrichum cereale]|nr:hypothetical protein LZ30DRAFT_384833 [Colletotrichum cereale]